VLYRLLTLPLLVSLLIVSGAVAADDSSACASDPDSAAAVAQRSTGGRVLSVKPSGRGEQRYRVKVLDTKGRVREVKVKGCGG
jgi:hypothetical protein